MNACVVSHHVLCQIAAVETDGFLENSRCQLKFFT